MNRPALVLGNAVFRGMIGGTGAKKRIQAGLVDGTFIPSPHRSDDSFAQSTRITPAEAGRLQTFPDDYPWQGRTGQVGQQIGNAVPPLLAAAIVTALTEEK